MVWAALAPVVVSDVIPTAATAIGAANVGRVEEIVLNRGASDQTRGVQYDRVIDIGSVRRNERIVIKGFRLHSARCGTAVRRKRTDPLCAALRDENRLNECVVVTRKAVRIFAYVVINLYPISMRAGTISLPGV